MTAAPKNASLHERNVTVIDQDLKAVAGLTELSSAEMEQVLGGADIVPVESFSLNFGAIKFEYKPQKED
jgi:type VI protein secretion system component Hcp